MPTGYTAKVGEGQSFRDFVINCSRAFGANVMRRDDPLDGSVKTYSVSSYYQERLNDAEQELEQHLQLDKEQYNSLKRRKLYQEYLDEKREYLELKQSYQNMIDNVWSWTPPTEKHKELKNFMLNQLRMSLRSDCIEPMEPTVPEIENYWEKDLSSIKWNISYYKNRLIEETERVNENNLWNKQLLESLR